MKMNEHQEIYYSCFKVPPQTAQNNKSSIKIEIKTAGENCFGLFLPLPYKEYKLHRITLELRCWAATLVDFSWLLRFSGRNHTVSVSKMNNAFSGLPRRLSGSISSWPPHKLLKLLFYIKLPFTI